jgi:hypothetical protein
MANHVDISVFVACIPIALGHEPSEAVVAVAVNRVGLPEFAMSVDRALLLDPERAREIAARIAEEFRDGCSGLAVLASFTEEDVRDRCLALDALRLELDFAFPFVEAVAVTGGRCFRPGCFDPECCPPEGVELPEVPSEVREIIEGARGRTSDDPRVLAFQRRGRDALAWEEALLAGDVADATTARRLAASLDDLRVRDWVVLTLIGAGVEAAEDALIGGESIALAEALDDALYGRLRPDAALVARFRVVVERVARAARGRRRRAATATLGAVLDWWEGNLSAARERCDRALEFDRDYRLAALVRAAAARGIGPGWAGRFGQTAQ